MMETKPNAGKNINEVFESSSYLRVIDDINANLCSNTSIIVLIGEPGTGKTLIAHEILKHLGKDDYAVLFEDPHFTVDEMISSACGQIGIASIDLQKKLEIEKKLQINVDKIVSSACEQTNVASTDLQKELEIEKKLQIFFEYLEKRGKKKGPVRLFIDKAQNIDTGLLSSILKLLKWRSDIKRALQVILIGSPQLKTVLTNPELSELKNVNYVYLHLKPLDTKEVEAFATQRLNTFNIERDVFFSLEAIEKIASYTRGIPGLVDNLIDSIMAIMNQNEHSVITEKLVDEAADFISIPWTVEMKNSPAIQSTSGHHKTDFDQSIQISSNSEGNNSNNKDNKINSETLISKVMRKVTNLFSLQQNEQVDAMNAREKTMNRSEVSNEELKALQNTLQQNKQINIMNTNAREGTMNRGELLNEELKVLQGGSPDVEAVALISDDGLMVASVLPQDLDDVRVGGMSATILSLGTRSSAELRRGKIEEIVIRGERGYTVMLNAGEGTLLLVVTNHNAKLGLIFFDMREAIKKIAGIL